MKKKIGILTFHRVSNYGAVLQAYALETALKNLGADCEIIGYQNSILTEQYNPYSRTYLNIRHPKRFLKNLVLLPYVKKRNRWFNDFRKTYLSVSEKEFDENNKSALATSMQEGNLYVASFWNETRGGNDILIWES